jgi:diacylglycerol kinase family enzyme
MSKNKRWDTLNVAEKGKVVAVLKAYYDEEKKCRTLMSYIYRRYSSRAEKYLTDGELKVVVG